MAISDDGNSAIVGGSGDDGGIGAASISDAQAARGHSGDKLAAGGTYNTGQGQAVGLSGSGTVAVVGGGFHAWAYAFSGGVWAQLGGAIDVDATRVSSLALSTDGSILLVGTPLARAGYFGAASVYVAGGVCTPPWIASQPQSQTIASGNTATLFVAATGTTPFSYQWYQGSSGDTSQPAGISYEHLYVPEY